MQQCRGVERWVRIVTPAASCLITHRTRACGWSCPVQGLVINILQMRYRITSVASVNHLYSGVSLVRRWLICTVGLFVYGVHYTGQTISPVLHLRRWSDSLCMPSGVMLFMQGENTVRKPGDLRSVSPNCRSALTGPVKLSE